MTWHRSGSGLFFQGILAQWDQEQQSVWQFSWIVFCFVFFYCFYSTIKTQNNINIYSPTLTGASNHFEIIQPFVQLNPPTHDYVRKDIFGRMEIHRADPGREHCPQCCSNQFQMEAGMSKNHLVPSLSSRGEEALEGDRLLRAFVNWGGGDCGTDKCPCIIYHYFRSAQTVSFCWLFTLKWAGKKAKVVYPCLLRECESVLFVCY